MRSLRPVAVVLDFDFIKLDGKVLIIWINNESDIWRWILDEAVFEAFVELGDTL